jgi:hypothetical protein
MQFELKLSIILINNTYSNKKQTDNHQNTTFENNNLFIWLNHYFIKMCFDGCQFAFYLYLQHNGMHKDKKTLNLVLLALMFIQ